MQDNISEDMTLKEALSQFGSIKSAIKNLKAENLGLQRQNERLQQENSELIKFKNIRSNELRVADERLENQRKAMNELGEKVNAHIRQFKLFESFIAMLLTSPSITNVISYLAELFKQLSTKGWITNLSLAEIRSNFIQDVMGDYLKSFKCEKCGAQFIVNKNHANVFNTYFCPACNTSYTVKADDTFLKLMVSEDQIKNTVLAGQLMKEIEVLKPFKSMLDIPCEICHKPITVWTESNLKLLIQGTGCGHVECWNSQTGKFALITKAVPSGNIGRTA